MHSISGKKIRVAIIILSCILILSLASTIFFYIIRQEINIGYAWAEADSFDINNITALNANKDGSFKIAQVSDLHLKTGILGSDKKALEGVKNLLNVEKPDLVVVTGDLVTSPLNFFVLSIFANLMEKHKTYWAYTLGNHDSDFSLSKSRIIKMLSGYEYCLIENGPNNITGNGNYFINIKNNDEIVYNLSFLDSNNYKEKDYGKYEFIDDNQIKWYEWTMANINESSGKTVNSMSFFHIPIYEYWKLYESAVYDGVVGERGIRTQGEAVKIFDAMKRQGSTQAVFVGHDHLNTFRGFYDDIYLCSATWSGEGTYHGKRYEDVTRGANIIEVNTNLNNFTVRQVSYENLN